MYTLPNSILYVTRDIIRHHKQFQMEVTLSHQPNNKDSLGALSGRFEYLNRKEKLVGFIITGVYPDPNFVDHTESVRLLLMASVLSIVQKDFLKRLHGRWKQHEQILPRFKALVIGMELQVGKETSQENSVNQTARLLLQHLPTPIMDQGVVSEGGEDTQILILPEAAFRYLADTAVEENIRLGIQK